ncbi:hypothetical protein KI387_025942, partial [Taxus chinensis]
TYDISGGQKNMENQIFSVDTLERHASKGHGIVTCMSAGNNAILVGTNKGWLVRYDFGGGDNYEVDLSVSRTGDQTVHRVFVDPGGKHCLAVVLSSGGAETYYTHAKWRKPRILSKLKGLVINAVAWNRQQISEVSTRDIVFGTMGGQLYEVVIEEKDKKEKHLKLLFELTELKESFVSLQMETIAIGSTTRYYIMAATPTRLYTFTGTGSLDVSSSSAYERNWLTYGWIHSLNRNKPSSRRVEKLFIHSALCLTDCKTPPYKESPTLWWVTDSGNLRQIDDDQEEKQGLVGIPSHDKDDAGHKWPVTHFYYSRDNKLVARGFASNLRVVAYARGGEAYMYGCKFDAKVEQKSKDDDFRTSHWGASETLPYPLDSTQYGYVLGMSRLCHEYGHLVKDCIHKVLEQGEEQAKDDFITPKKMHIAKQNGKEQVKTSNTNRYASLQELEEKEEEDLMESHVQETQMDKPQEAQAQLKEHGQQQLVDGSKAQSIHEMQQVAQQYFQQLFTSQSLDMDSQLLNILPTNISHRENEKLIQPVTEQELQGIVFSMKKGKTPGPDGFPIEFYQDFWDIIKGDLYKWLKKLD